MAFVDINPRYRPLLERLGLRTAEQFLALPAVVISGHDDRHVAQVQLGTDADALTAYLKREHRIPWRDRLVNAWQGFGPVTKSYREARMLQAVEAAGIACPDWIAVGSDAQGRAFLLVRAMVGLVELRRFLRQQLPAPASVRRRFAAALGESLARLHDAGFDHPDLYAKHVLVGAAGQSVAYLDWQRGTFRPFLSWGRRWRDLAALDATLAADLATPRERLACLRAYLRSSFSLVTEPGFLKRAAREVTALSQALLHRRHVREMRQAPVEFGTQNLIWLDGEALCVTREFLSALDGRLPEWLRPACPGRASGSQVTHDVVSLPFLPRAELTRRQEMHPLRWLWAWLCRRRVASPEFEQARALFRLQRYGVATPRLLAVGQRQASLGRTESFVLTAPPHDTVALAEWLRAAARRDRLRQRWDVLRQAGQVLQRIHQAGYHLGGLASGRGAPGDTLQVCVAPGTGPAVVLGNAQALRRCRRLPPARAVRDLALLAREAAAASLTATEQLRFLLAYLAAPGLTPAVKWFIGHSLGGRRSFRLAS